MVNLMILQNSAM